MPHPNPYIGMLPYVGGLTTLGAQLEMQRRMTLQYERMRILMLCGAPFEAALATVKKGNRP